VYYYRKSNTKAVNGTVAISNATLAQQHHHNLSVDNKVYDMMELSDNVPYITAPENTSIKNIPSRPRRQHSHAYTSQSPAEKYNDDNCSEDHVYSDLSEDEFNNKDYDYEKPVNVIKNVPRPVCTDIDPVYHVLDRDDEAQSW